MNRTVKTFPFLDYIVVLLSLLLLITAQYKLRLFTWDDSYITYRHALNMAKGFGCVYNPGEMVDGITNYFLALVLSWGIRVGWDPVAFSKWIGILTAWGTLILAWRITVVRLKVNSVFAGIAVLMLATSGMFALESVGGLETSLFTFLVLLLLWEITSDKNQKRYRMCLIRAGIISGVMMLTRPDAALFILLVLIFILSSKDIKQTFSNLAAYLTPVVLLYLPYFIHHYLTYGYPFPNSYYAKKMATSNLLGRGLERLFTNLQDSGILIAIVLLIILMLVRKFVKPSHLKLQNMGTLYLLIAFILFRMVFIVATGGPWMGWGRFLVPVIPLFYIAVTAMLYFIYNEAKPSWFRIPVTIFVLTVIAINYFYSEKHLFREKTPSLHLDRIHIPLGKTLGDILETDESISFGDAGALPYYSNLVNIDPAGLCDAHIAHLKGDFNVKTDPEYILSRNPTVIILNSINRPPEFNPQSPIDHAIASYPGLREKYVNVLSFEAWPGYNLWLFVRKDRAEYVKNAVMTHPQMSHVFK